MLPAIARAMVSWPPPEYRMRTTINAPLDFVYRWCTDYRSDDARRAGEKYNRRVIARTRQRVLFEDLWWEPDGWRWRRSDVTLLPPDRWHADSIGNGRTASIEYRLTDLPRERTQLEIRMRRRPGLRSTENPPKAHLERELRVMWRHFGSALETDYRRGRRRRSSR